MYTIQALTDHGLRLAVETLLHKNSPDLVERALVFLDARIPQSFPRVRTAYIAAADFVRYDEARADSSERDSQQRRRVVDELAAWLNNLPQVSYPRTRAEFREQVNQLGMPGDWHEPDQQDIDTVVTEGQLDNAGHTLLESQILIRKNGETYVQVALATALSWASTLDR